MGHRIVAIFEIIIILAAFLLLTSFVITTNTNDAIISNTESFVEQVRYKGVIPKESYEKFLTKMPVPVDVRIQLTTTDWQGNEYMLYKLVEDASGNYVFEGEIDALGNFNSGVSHALRPGDLIEVIVRKPSGSYFDQVVSFFNTGAKGAANNPAIAIKGGMILNSIY